MGNHAAWHPTEQTLSDFSLGKLDDSRAELINNHLNECPDCQRSWPRCRPIASSAGCEATMADSRLVL